MSQSQKIISCLLSIAVIFGIMLTITCMAVEDANTDGGDVVESSSEVVESTSSEGNTEEEESSEGEESQGEESESTEESSEESSEEESDEEEESTGNKYYYAGDVSYPPYTGSRVLKNPNMVEEESKPEEKDDKPVEKDIKDWSYVARRWVFLPIIFTVLSLGGLIWFNLYAKKTKRSKG